MSLDATRWAWQQDIRPTHKLVLLSLADRAGENHDCFPSIDRLIHDTGLHKQTIMEAIAQMEKLGILKVSRTDGKSNHYTLIGVKNRNDADQYEKPYQHNKTDATEINDQYEKAVRFSDQVEKPTRLKNRTTPVRKTVLDQYEKPYPNLSIESNKEPTNIHTRFSALVYLLDHGVDKQTSTDYLAIRRAKKLTPTLKALEAIGIEAERAGLTFAEAIGISCANSWAGFKADWLKTKDSHQPLDTSIFKE